VRELYFDTYEAGCALGAPLDEPMPLPEPAAGAPKDLARAMLAAAKELAKEPVDANAIKALLSPFGTARYDHNDMTLFTWVRVSPASAPIAPFCFSDFRYVKEPALLCHVTSSNRHLYEIDGTKTHRIFLSVDIATASLGQPTRISFMELTAMPRAWPTPIF
jgi:hypothetical protein